MNDRKRTGVNGSFRYNENELLLIELLFESKKRPGKIDTGLLDIPRITPLPSRALTIQDSTVEVAPIYPVVLDKSARSVETSRNDDGIPGDTVDERPDAPTGLKIRYQNGSYL